MTLNKDDFTVELASEQDSEALKAFTIEQPFLTNDTVHLAINRKSSFFDKYRLQSEDFVTYKMLNSNGEIEGIASLLFRKTSLNGQETLMGYACDLRISKSRQAIVQWADKLLPALTEAANERDCQYVFSSFNMNQTQTLNTLIRPKIGRKNALRFYLYKNFKFITIHGKVPFTNLPFLSSVKLDRLTDNDIEPLAKYLHAKTFHRPLSFNYTPDFLQNRIRSWPGFEKENFILAKDHRNNIIGCVAPWKASQIFNVTVLNYSGFGETIYAFSKWLSYMKFVKRLPSVNDRLPLKFLTHFHADNPDIFGALLSEVFRITSREELLTYIHFNGVPLTLPPRSFLTSQIPFALYSVLPADRALPDFLYLNRASPPPDLESVLI